jgi:acid phosphatase class B
VRSPASTPAAQPAPAATARPAADPSIRAIRILRSPVSYNERPFQPGKYGEEILANSAD